MKVLIEPGRELDRIISEEVMGHRQASKYLHFYTDELGEEHALPVPRYSTDLTAAWVIVLKLESEGLQVTLQSRGIGYRAVFSRTRGVGVDTWAASASTPEMAVCLASLEALKRHGNSIASEVKVSGENACGTCRGVGFHVLWKSRDGKELISEPCGVCGGTGSRVPVVCVGPVSVTVERKPDLITNLIMGIGAGRRDGG